MYYPTITAWMLDSPFRLLDYRWSRATWIHQEGKDYKANPATDDEWVAQACRVLSQASGEDTPKGSRSSAIREALLLNRQHDSITRWQLEAYLLTSEPFADIGRRCALPEPVVEAYHHLFFCVRDRLDCCDWIHQVCFGPGFHSGFRPGDIPYIWRMFAYQGGANILEIVIAVSLRRPLPPGIRVPAGQDRRAYETRLRLSVQLAIGAHMMRTLSEAKIVLRLQRMKLQLDRAVKGKDTASDAVIETMLSFMEIGQRRRSPRPKRPGSRFARILDSGRQQKDQVRQSAPRRQIHDSDLLR